MSVRHVIFGKSWIFMLAVTAAAMASDLPAKHPPVPALPIKTRGPDYDRIRKEHWAYQPVQKSQPPPVRDAAWPADDIDRFLLATLESKNLKPADDAAPATLVRRLYFDLTGLPPTPLEIETFVKNPSRPAYEKMVDGLLASPRFGERWGRHWLDVARYAESVTLRGLVLKDAWRYRDYVIDTFNADRPFDQFMQEQVAGDLLSTENTNGTVEERRRQMTGTTFLAMGNTNLEDQDKKQLDMDVVDEQLETLSRAFLAQTVGCARCHDHKFDPIPTADYYAMAGILKNVKVLEHANVSKWLSVPLPMPAAREKEFEKFDSEVAALQGKLISAKAVVAAAKSKATDKAASGGKPVVVAVKNLPGVVLDDADAKFVGTWKLSTYTSTYIGVGYSTDGNSDKGSKTLTFQPTDLPHSGKYEVRFAYTPGGNRAPHVPVTVFSADGEKTVDVNEQEPPAIDGHFVSLGTHTFDKNGQGYVLVSNENTKGFVIADAVQFLPVDGPVAATPQKDTAAPMSDAEKTVRKLEVELKKLNGKSPPRDTVLSVTEGTEFADTQVHLRGNVHTLGPTVPRGYLSCVQVSHPPAIPSNHSGRRELGQWLADPENPLPARVMANRCWNWLFGDGIVRTVDNFGTTGEAPSDPALLDYLATELSHPAPGPGESGNWSMKMLIRRLVLSRTYRVSSEASPSLVVADPENRMFGRAMRRRLDAECIRDAMLSVSGKLDLTTGGMTFKPDIPSDYGFKYTENRRSVYMPVFRNALPDLFEVFDFADPSASTGRRNVSTVAPQALFLMNHPFVKGQAKAAAERLLAEPLPDDTARLAQAYRLALGRRPTAGEQTTMSNFLSTAAGPAARQEAWAQVYHALFASIDFRYVE